jgi:hypothetical protein
MKDFFLQTVQLLYETFSQANTYGVEKVTHDVFYIAERG